MGKLILGLAGQTISRIVFDFAITLATEEGSELRIETRFSFRDPAGMLWIVEPSGVGPVAVPLLSLLHGVIDTSVAREDSGNLILQLRDGSRIEVCSDVAFEAWTFAGPTGEKLISSPGGGLSYWSPDLSAPT